MNLSAKRFIQTGEYQVFFRGIYWQQQAETGQIMFIQKEESGLAGHVWSLLL